MSDAVRELVERYMPEFDVRRCGKVFTDTTQFMDINHGDVIELAGSHYLVLKDESERRFGMEDPKYWVKRCRELESGQPKILKLVFFERFPLNVGDFEVLCYRSPEKESRILDLVADDHRFMHGVTRRDDHDNPVRILDIVQGREIGKYVYAVKADHETYFHEHFPAILDNFMGACEAIASLHAQGEKHGDIRRDHLFIEYGTGAYRWIDFDYTFDFHENPFGLDIFGLGNILIYCAGKQVWNLGNLDQGGFSAEVLNGLDRGDHSLVIRNRVVNLRKLFPYIPAALNNVFLHFSQQAEVFYDTVEELLDELRPCRALLG
ncbi:hypothetical protein DND132_1400 [Pseudodesulfovibrio mercurii]|uniref:Serine/threonine protein kinase n=1 Tax=Pseudodesulfovibrio mercurii TaxID=641491 RepID=F0JDS6_9BACT|nr:hypothetical protein [Pseudodesulfovibrio mercurii]EGB14608.1 hypothetical protein DND132_1400 [Pseudodesulfovibrio mercurii]